MSAVNIIDLVGKQTKTRFRNSNVKRAITVGELDWLLKNEKEHNIVVIESVREKDTEKLKKCIQSNTETNFLFYIEDTEEAITSGVADELDIDILLSIDEVYNKIKEITGVNVSAHIRDISKEVRNEQLGDSSIASIEDVISQFEDTENEESAEEASEEYAQDTWEESEQDEVEESTQNALEESKQDTWVGSEDTEDNEAWSSIDEEMGEANRGAEASAENSLEENSENYSLESVGVTETEEINNEKIKTLIDDIKRAENRIQELEKLVLMSKQEKNDIESIINGLRSDIIENPVDGYLLEEAKERIEELEKIREGLEREVEKAVLGNEETEKRLCEKEKELDENKNIVMEVTEKLNSEKDENEKLIGTINEITEKSRESNEKLATAVEKERELTARIAELETETQGNSELLKDKDKRLAELEIENNKLMDKVSETDNENMESSLVITKLRKEKEILEKRIEEASKMGSNDSSREVEELNGKIEIYQSKIDELIEKNTSLEAKVKEAESRGNDISSYGKEAVEEFRYKGKAKVISVFGTGGSGTTTMVMSLVNKLKSGKRIVVVDMDFMYPNVDMWLRKSPAVKYGGGLKPVDSTSLGIFIKRGFDEFRAADESIKRVESTSIGGLDFIGNTINFFSDDEIACGEYNKLIEYLGMVYDYIIIDHGTIGSSDSKDSVIKAMVNSCSEGILVAANELRKVRVAELAVDRAGIDRSKVTLVLNMCTNKSVIDRVADIIKRYKGNIMIPYYQQIVNDGRNKGFLASAPSSEKVSELVNNLQ